MNKASYTTDVPRDRFRLLDRIGELGKPAKIMLVGGTDSGKTTLLTFLINGLLERGFRVAVIDSDVGQKSVLPPATISLALPEKPVSNPSELTGVVHYFVGALSPAQYSGEMAVGVKRLVDEAVKSAEVVLIDTTGFVSGIGAEIKRMKAELVRPDLVALLQSPETEHLREVLSPYSEVFGLKISPHVRRHSLEDRRELRFEKWRAYFSNSRLVRVDLLNVRLSGTSLFQGRPLSEEERELLSRVFNWLVLAGWKGNSYTVVKSDAGGGRSCYDRFSLKAVDFDSLSNIIVGLIDKNGLCCGVGILKWINFSEGSAEILTPVNEETFERTAELRFGRVRVLESGEELGMLGRDDI